MKGLKCYGKDLKGARITCLCAFFLDDVRDDAEDDVREDVELGNPPCSGLSEPQQSDPLPIPNPSSPTPDTTPSEALEKPSPEQYRYTSMVFKGSPLIPSEALRQYEARFPLGIHPLGREVILRFLDEHKDDPDQVARKFEEFARRHSKTQDLAAVGKTGWIDLIRVIPRYLKRDGIYPHKRPGEAMGKGMGEMLDWLKGDGV